MKNRIIWFIIFLSMDLGLSNTVGLSNQEPGSGQNANQEQGSAQNSNQEPGYMQDDPQILEFLESLYKRRSDDLELEDPMFPLRENSNEQLVNSCGCAKNTFSPVDHSKIVGGEIVHPNSVPYQVMLHDWRGKTMCGGTILNKFYILTAMHCVYKNMHSPLSFYIYAGIHSICPNVTNPYMQKKTVREVIASNEFPYNNRTFENDIALLRLNSPLNFGQMVQPVCLAQDQPVFNISGGEIAFVSGWGRTLQGGITSCLLRFVDLMIWSDNDCLHSQTAHIYQNYMNVTFPTSTMMCAGYPDGGKSSCQGDSGGPLILSNSDGRVQLVGAVSWGVGCAQVGLPVVFTKVQFFNQWIRESIQDGECNCKPSPCTLPDPTGQNPPSTTTSGTTNSGATTTTTHSPATTTTYVATTSVYCHSEWYNDTYCDESNNRPECNFDMGDCCNRNTSDWNYYCRQCECCEPGHPNYDCTVSYTTPALTTSTQPSTSSTSFSSSSTATSGSTSLTSSTPTSGSTPPPCKPSWYNDSFCDDVNNTPECSYDLGDCCERRHADWNKYCAKCECCEPGHVNYTCGSSESTTITTILTSSTTVQSSTASASTPRPHPLFGCILNYINDGYCDDENNRPCCNFDSGDCCQQKRPDWNKFCTACQCHSP